MNLKTARIEAKLQQTDVVPKLKAIEPHVDVGVLSRYEHGICIPTPPQFRKLCEIYHKEPHELYRPEEVDFGVKKRKSPKASDSLDTYKLTARIPLSFIGDVDKLKAMIKACGYHDITGWVLSCLKRLQVEYRRKKKTATGVTAPKAASKDFNN